jgi:hypothetical protein
MLMKYLKRTWMLIALIFAAILICGPCEAWIVKHLGPGFAQTALIVDKLSALCMILLAFDFVLDCRKQWGLFPTLDLDAAIDTAIRGAEEDAGTGERKANPIACALVFLGVIALLMVVMLLAVPRAGAVTLDNARPYLSTLSQSIDKSWPGAPLRQITAGQIEQESSWKERATLKTSRELGRGLVQMTIAYDKDGKERFNIYKDAVRNRQLAAWDWQRDPYNVPYQMRFLVIQDRANFNMVRAYCINDDEGWKCALVSYNAGSGRWLFRLKNARRQGLPADRWDGGLDRAYSKGEAALLYGRPLYEAVNEYPRVIFKRADKYRGLV